MKTSTLWYILIWHLPLIFPYVAYASTADLPQTGQITCYDASGIPIACAGTVQDGELKAGVPWPNPRFFDNGDLTVIDNLTGLIWVQDANLMKTRDPGFDMDMTAGDGNVTWENSLDYMALLNIEKYLGYADWRLPNANELASLINVAEGNNSAWLTSSGFMNVQSDGYWTSTSCTKDASNATGVSMPYGNIFYNNSDKLRTVFYVWPVRTGQSDPVIHIPQSGQNTCYDASGIPIACEGTGQDGELRTGAAWGELRFSDNDDLTMTDNLTGLMWAQDGYAPGPVDCGPSALKTWQGSLDYVRCLNDSSYLGYNDWRLPNRNELHSLYNHGQEDSAAWLNSSGFLNVQENYYWSSNSFAYNAIGAWVVDMVEGHVSATYKSLSFCAWPVRSGQISNPIISVSPAMHNFGSLDIGNSSSTTEFVISNTSTDMINLHINSIAVEDGYWAMFSVATGGANPCGDLNPILPPNVTCTIAVTFAPTSTGVKTATLRIASSDAKKPIIDIPLSGTGLDNSLPTSTISTPANGSTLEGLNHTIEGTASDIGSGVLKVEVSTDNGVTWNIAAGTTTWSYTWTLPADGSYTINTRATDNAGNVQTTTASVTVVVNHFKLTFGDSQYPVLWSGQAIHASAAILKVEFFSPLFGKERRQVNPAMPLINDTVLTFPKPGEYYLRINNDHFLKVLVLSPEEPISAGVVRIFDFCVANMLYAMQDDNAFYADQSGFVLRWFESEEPVRLLCGPTHAVFYMLVKDRLDLPIRKVTFPGTFKWEGEVSRSSHNVLEVYLPDLGKWVLFDVNNAFLVRWMDALEFVGELRKHPSPYETGFFNYDDFKLLNVYDETPRAFFARDTTDLSVGPFSPAQVTRIPVSYLWKETFRFYYSGVAYWGQNLEWAAPTGTDFLPGDYVFASMHTDPELEKEAIEWVESFGLAVTVVTPDALASMLAQGSKQEIEAKAWLKRLP